MTEILNGTTYTKKEIADKLHVTVRTVNKYIKAGKLQAVKVGARRVLITETALNTFLESNAKTI